MVKRKMVVGDWGSAVAGHRFSKFGGRSHESVGRAAAFNFVTAAKCEMLGG
ncbi:hypothetical protein FHT76_007833 [Rhizobium sp. BK176]|nr:hypothetical protein [Rhizobium sp. BK176]